MMSATAILAMIDARAATDPEFAGHVTWRRDPQIAAALSVGRTKLRERLITERGVISALGPVEGEALLAGLFTGGDRAVINGDTLNVSYTASA